MYNIYIYIAAGEIPTRKANISLRIIMEYLPEYEDLNSQKSKNLIAILKREVCHVTFLKKLYPHALAMMSFTLWIDIFLNAIAFDFITVYNRVVKLSCWRAAALHSLAPTKHT